MIKIPNSFYGPLVGAIFRRRLHRFAAEVELNTEIETVHIPNSGRLGELLFAGNEVGLHFEGHAKRKTRYTLVSALTEEGWAYVDSRLPNHILKGHWRRLPPLADYAEAFPESSFGSSRFDLGLKKAGQEQMIYLEAKCVTLVRAGGGLFPDAPTLRGRKHLLELTRLALEGRAAYVIFFLQHPGGYRLQANAATDPHFAAALAEARQAGVRLHAYRVLVETRTLILTAVPIILDQ